MRSVLCAILIAGSVVGAATRGPRAIVPGHAATVPAQLGDDGTYKNDELWWSRNFQGFDFLEPLIPRVAVARGNVGNIVLDSGVPYSLLTTAFAVRSTDPATLLRAWLDSWSGIGHIAVGMHRQGFDVQLTHYDERGWRATFYTTGMEHSPTGATGNDWDRTPSHATQRAAWQALRRAMDSSQTGTA